MEQAIAEATHAPIRPAIPAPNAAGIVLPPAIMKDAGTTTSENRTPLVSVAAIIAARWPNFSLANLA
ncbi:hypothetical protein D3C77_802000 [compost metagenome]